MQRPDPIAEFQRVFAKAKESEEAPYEATAMMLATADAEGRPSARMVLLKAVDERGFAFYTNFESRKAEQLEANPQAALTWYWATRDLQVRAEGPVTRVPDEEADAYFATRPRGSQLGAWASKQSRPLSSRAKLLARVARVEARHLGREISRPPFWGGYRLAPERMEFWHNRLNRLHDRHLYLRDEEGAWSRQRLYP